MFQELYDKGYSVIPITPKGKAPCDKKYGEFFPMAWSGYRKALAPPHLVKDWETWGCGIGVVLGRLSGIVGLDLDDDLGNLHNQILNIAPETPVIKRGQKGCTLFYQYDEELFRKKLTWNKDGVRVAELLTEGQQTVLPPSVHPNGKPYEWIGEKRLDEVCPKDLPKLTATMVQRINNLFRVENKRIERSKRQYSLSEVSDALKVLSNDTREMWLKVGMGLKASFGEAGFSTWDLWSKSSEKYEEKQTQRAAWESFKNDGTTVGTIIYEARMAGWVPTHDEEVEHDNIRLAFLDEQDIRQEPWDVPLKLIENAPNLVGKVLQHILKTSRHPDPNLALAATLPFVGHIMGHRVKLGSSDDAFRSNICTIGLGKSSGGKDHALKSVWRFLEEIGMGESVIGVFNSSTSVASAVLERNGHAFLPWDEFGRTLEGYSSNNSAGHVKEITTNIMKLYNCSNGRYIGNEYANNKMQGGRKDIEQPCLSIYATSVPQNFYSSLRHTDVADGFLARWMVFETELNENYNREFDGNMALPETLKEELIRWKETPIIYSEDFGKAGDVGTKKPCPIGVPFTEEAKEFMNDYYYRKWLQKNACEKIGDSDAYALWGRAGEHASKLALIGHEYAKPIDLRTVEWATELADNRVQFIIGALARNLAGSIHEKNTKRILEYIRKCGKQGASLSEITRNHQRLSMREREEALQTLVLSGQIEKINKGKTIFKYIRLTK